MRSRLFRPEILFWILLGMLVVQRIVVLCVFNSSWTDSDQTLYWIVAKDYSEGNFHQPFLFGQDYGYAIEALLAVPLLWCKVPVQWALPIVTNLLAILPFVSFAFWFRKQNRHAAAIILLIVPLFLPISYSLITSMPRGFINGVAVFALWPLVQLIMNLHLRYLLSGFILMASFVINPNVVFLVMLVGGFALVNADYKIRFAVFAMAGAVIPFALHTLAKQWAVAHSNELMHHAWDFYYNADYFFQSFKDTPFAFFRGVLPLTESGQLISILIFPLLAAYAFFKKKYAYGVIAFVIFAGIIASLSVSKVSDGGVSVFFPRSRMFLALPLVLALLLAELPKLNAKLIGIVLIASGIIFAGIQTVQVPSAVAAETTSTELVPLYFAPIDSVRRKAQQLRDFAKRNAITYYGAHTNPQSICEVQIFFNAGECFFEDFPISALPESERRWWRRSEVLAAPVSASAWIGGSNEQWAHVNEVVDSVETIRENGTTFHRLHSDTITNQEVYSAMRKFIGLPE